MGLSSVEDCSILCEPFSPVGELVCAGVRLEGMWSSLSKHLGDGCKCHKLVTDTGYYHGEWDNDGGF